MVKIICQIDMTIIIVSSVVSFRVNPFLTNADEAERGSKRRLGKGPQHFGNIREAHVAGGGDECVADGRQDLRGIAAAGSNHTPPAASRPHRP